VPLPPPVLGPVPVSEDEGVGSPPWPLLEIVTTAAVVDEVTVVPPPSPPAPEVVATSSPHAMRGRRRAAMGPSKRVERMGSLLGR
jgi:hypothetical protein